MNNFLQLSFIICTYNRANYLDDTLIWLLQLTQQAPVEVVVIDNNSSDSTARIITNHQRHKNAKALRYIKETKQGLSHARNRGIAEARAPYVVFLDDDIRPGPSLVSAWLHFFDTHPQAVAAGGKIHVQFDDPCPPWMSHYLLPLLGHHDLGNSLQKYPSGKYPFGGNMAFKKSFFNKSAAFDPALGRKGKALKAGEEKELFGRIRSQMGDIYYVPHAFLYHRVDKSRLTIPYIKAQAAGLGNSMHFQLANTSPPNKLKNGLMEAAKFIGSGALALGYLAELNLPKAAMLFKFRWWIWKAYFTN